MKTTFLICSLCILLTGCQCKDEKPFEEKPLVMDPLDDQTLKLNIQGDPTSLNPHMGIDLNCRTLQKALFEGLTRIVPSGEPILACAKTCTISDDRKIYTFTLRDTLWSNGEKVRAEHFEKAWKRALTPNSNSLRVDLFYPIKNAKEAKKGAVSIDEVGIKAVDETTLVIELEYPIPYFLDLLAQPLYSPLYDSSDNPTVFNGPFIVDSWKHEEFFSLKANPFYWDQEHVKLKEIKFSLVKDPNTAFLMYEKGELDWAGNPFTLIPTDAIPKLENTHEIHRQPVSGVYWFSCNTKSFPLNSVYLRKALSYALDRKAFTTHVLYGESPSQSLIPTNVSLNGNELYPINITEANIYLEKALEELHLTRETFPVITISHSDVPGQKKLAETVAEFWEKNLGIKVELLSSEWNVFFDNLRNHRFQIGGCIWYSLVNDPIYNLEFFRDAENVYNTCQWENLNYKRLLDLANQETDLKTRKDYLRQAELILLDEMPIIPVFATNFQYLVKDNVKDVFISNLGLADFKYMHISNPALR